MNLLSIPENPVPEGAVVEAVTTADGVRLRAAHWRPHGSAKGTVCLFQGRAEMIEKYFEVVRELLARGFAVALFDWRGQGGSERRLKNPRKGHVDDVAEYERDLDAFMRQVALADCPPPYFALGHSTGCLVLLRVARHSRLRFQRMVLASPLIDLGPLNPPRRFVGFAATALAALGLGDFWPPGRKSVRFLLTHFEGNPLTSDPRRFARNLAITAKAPALSIGAPTVGWLQALCRAMDEAAEPGFAATVQIPALLISGGEDRVVSNRATERFAHEMRTGDQLVIPGARHEILMEREHQRRLFWAAFDAFIPGTR